MSALTDPLKIADWLIARAGSMQNAETYKQTISKAKGLLLRPSASGEEAVTVARMVTEQGGKVRAGVAVAPAAPVAAVTAAAPAPVAAAAPAPVAPVAAPAAPAPVAAPAAAAADGALVPEPTDVEAAAKRAADAKEDEAALAAVAAAPAAPAAAPAAAAAAPAPAAAPAAAAAEPAGPPAGGRSRKTRHHTPKRKKLSRKKSVKRK